MISASVAPLARAIISRIFAPLLSARGAAALGGRTWRPSCWPSRLPWLPSSARRPWLCPCLAPLAVFLALGAPFFWLAAFLAGAFSGATCAPCAATAAALSALVSAFVMCVGILFCACFAHDDSSLWSREKASGKVSGRWWKNRLANTWRFEGPSVRLHNVPPQVLSYHILHHHNEPTMNDLHAIFLNDGSRRQLLRSIGLAATGASFTASAFGQGRCRDGYGTPSCPLAEESATAPIPAAVCPHWMEDRGAGSHHLRDARLSKRGCFLHRADGLDSPQR